MPQDLCSLSLKKIEDGENKGEHRHRRRSHHKPRHHHIENGEAPKNPDKSERKNR